MLEDMLEEAISKGYRQLESIQTESNVIYNVNQANRDLNPLLIDSLPSSSNEKAQFSNLLNNELNATIEWTTAPHHKKTGTCITFGTAL